MDAVGLGLWPGERLLWQGCPVRNTMFRPHDAILIPFSIVAAVPLLAGAVLLLNVSWYLKHPIAIVCALGGLSLSILMIYLLIGRFVARAVGSRHLRYVVTDKRVVILGGRSGRRETSAWLDSLAGPVFTEARDGSGSIAFGVFPPVWTSREGGRGIPLSAFSGESPTPVLWYVADVRRVCNLIAAAQHRDPSAGAPPRALAPIDMVGRPRAAGMVMVFVFLITVSSVATGLGLSRSPQLWWPQTSATVAECTPKPLSRRGTPRDVCTLVWSEGGTEHTALKEFRAGRHPEGSTLTVAVHGDTVVEWDEIVLLMVALGQSLVCLSGVLVGFVIWYRRHRRWRRSTVAAPSATGPDPRSHHGSPPYRPSASSAVEPSERQAADSFALTASRYLLRVVVFVGVALCVYSPVTGQNFPDLLQPPIGPMVIGSFIFVAAVLGLLRHR